MTELPVIPKHLMFAHVLVLCKEELTFSEAVFGWDGLFRWGYDEPAIEDVEAWLPLPTRAALAQEAGPVAEHQEPVAEVYRGPVSGVNRIRWINSRTQPVGSMLYTSPPAPVAVVLPNRNEVHLKHPLRMDGTELVQVWNACLDKVKELNQFGKEQ